MVSIALWTLTVAVVAGSGLALWHLRGAVPPPVAAGSAHGIVGAIGLGILILALRGPVRGAAAGVGSFGAFAAVLFAAAAVTGIALLLLRRRPLVMAIHAGIAITAYVLLLAWNALG